VRHLRSVGRAPGPVLRDRRRHIASAGRAPVLARQSHSDHSFDIAQIGQFLAARDE
jgi:5'-deoxynucleotidase YfbR-like HD superfamily hydrolase